MDELEIEFYSKKFKLSFESGDSWHTGPACAIISKNADAYELLYTNAAEHPLEGAYLMAGMVLQYPTLFLRPLGSYFFGLMCLSYMGSIMKYIHGRSHLVLINYNKKSATNFMRWCDGL